MNIYEQLILTFISGGLICVIAQLLIDLTSLTPARILVLYVSVGVLLYGVGIYDTLFNIFGAGMSVPLIGFGANIGKGVKEAVDSTGLIGAFGGGLSAASVGITVALLCGFFASLLFKSKSKRM